MHRFAAEIPIEASLRRVWALLTDFEAYPTWTNALVLSGEISPDAPLDYSLKLERPIGLLRRLDFQAFVTAVQVDHALRWRFGAPGLIVFEFGFELEPDGLGCRLRHAVETRRLLGRAVGIRLERQLMPTFEAFLGDVQRKVQPAAPSPKPPPPKPLAKSRPKSGIPPTLPPHRRRRWR